MENREPSQAHWPYNKLEKYAWYQSARFIIALFVAPGMGIWLLASGQCQRWIEYAGAVLLIMMGVLGWTGVVQGLLRRRRVGGT